MRQLLAGTLLAALVTAGAHADDKGKEKPKPDAPAAEFQALLEAYAKATADIYKSVEAAETPEEQQRIFEKERTAEKIRKLNAEYARRVLAFAAAHAADRKVAGAALAWVVRNDATTPEAAAAVDALVRDHLNDKNPEVERLLGLASRDVSEQGERLLRAAAEKSADAGQRTRVRYYLARSLKTRAEGVATAKAMDETTRKLAEQLRGKAYLDWLAGGDAAKFLKEAEDRFEALARDGGDAKVSNQPVKELAAAELFEIRHLSIGKVAPEIAGEDVDGKAFKLSEYRGKVVVLDFWGHW